jgi:hypothetical protein
MADETPAADLPAQSFRDLDRAAAAAGRTLAAMLAEGESGGKRLESALRAAGDQLARIALQAGTRTLGGSLAAALAPALESLAGGAAAAGNLAAPAALAGLDGAASTAGAAASAALAPAQPAVSVTMNVQTPDAESFQRSEGQIGAALSRLVARGQRLL